MSTLCILIVQRAAGLVALITAAHIHHEVELRNQFCILYKEK